MCSTWALCKGQVNFYLGQIGIHQIDWTSKVARVALVIGSRSEFGKGFGSDALQQALKLSFELLDLHKVWLMVFRTNQRAVRTYQRAGFIQEGILHEEYLHRGEYHDMVRMSVLAKEWQALNA